MDNLHRGERMNTAQMLASIQDDIKREAAMNTMLCSVTDSIHQPDDMEMIDPPEGIKLFEELSEATQVELLMDQLGEPYGNGRSYLGQLSWLHSIGADVDDFLNEAKGAAVDNDYAVEQWRVQR